jgi:ethanolamine-phosphate cytidylyltransferase
MQGSSIHIHTKGRYTNTAQYISAAIFGSPFSLSRAFLLALPYASPTVYHGVTTFMPLPYDPYAVPKTLGIYKEIANHGFQNVNAQEIVGRILKGREVYEERQRRKGEKGVGERGVEEDEREREKERGMRRREVEGQFGI